MKTLQLSRDPLRLALLTLLVVLPGLLCPSPSPAASGTVTAWGNNGSDQTNVPPELTSAVSVAAGDSHSLAIRTDGTVFAWGSAALTNLPAGLSNVVQVAGGGTHSLALRADGTVAGWGANYYPDPDTLTGQAMPPADLANAVGIAAGWAHSVTLRYDHTVIAWGCNKFGQTNVPANLGPVMAVAAGDWFTAALRSDGTVVAWGDNSVGQTNVPAGLGQVVAISARGGTLLALQQNGQVMAWGEGSAGQTNVPADLTNAVAIAAGSQFEMALRDDGRVAAWGDNSAAEIAGATGLTRVTALAAGGAHGLALLGNGAPQITLQPRSQAAAAGTNVTLVVKAVGDPFLTYQWRKDGLDLTNSTSLSGTTTPTLSVANPVGPDAGGYSVVISNGSGSVTSAVAALTILNSAAADSFNPNANNTVNALALQEDGKVLLAGNFTTLGGQTRPNLARLNSDGTIDYSFNAGTGAAAAIALAVLPDHKILVVGLFSSFGGQARSNLARLNTDGSLDTAFATACSGPVLVLALQADGRALLGGAFGKLGEEAHTNIGRLNADGTPDTTFKAGADNDVSAIVIQPDGKILVGGAFTILNGTNCSYLGRLNADGTLDTNFTAVADGTVYCLALQADGKILVGGNFTALNGQSRNYLGRLNADGSLDTTFDPGANYTVYSLAVQTDGRIVVGGYFTWLGGQTSGYIGRVNADGSLDGTFTGSADSFVNALAVQADGRIIVGGEFTSLGGQPRNRIGRLTNTEPATASLYSEGLTATWRRAGTGPEVLRTSFDASTNGVDWFSLGVGTRILGGWQVQGLSLPANATLRARGFCPSGRFDGSGSTVEQSLGPPVIEMQPRAVAALTNTVIALGASAAGTPPLAYHWYKNGAAIADATNSTFTIQAALAADTGAYDVVVTNILGSITSAVATVTVMIAPVADTFNPGAGNAVYALAVQPDGKVVAGGSFSTLGGQTRKGLGRLNIDGSLDSSFNPTAGGTSAVVESLALQTDGRILVGGMFTILNGLARPYLGRLYADGNVDASFNPSPNGAVFAVMLQADGKVLVGGNFTLLGGQACTNLGRLNADGSLDTTFSSPGPNSRIITMALQADGKIVVGGYFTTLGGQPRNYIGRLNPDGQLDNDFDPGANSYVFSLAVQPEGKILVGGSFTALGGQTRSYIGRLNPDGTPDLYFSPVADNVVDALALQADGKIVLGGIFTRLCWAPHIGIGRINADGSVDATFNPAGGGTVYALAAQTDGRLLVGGSFGTLGGQTRSCIARLINNVPAAQSVTFENSTFTWLRGGTSPEIWYTTLETCTNGLDWNSLGSCARILGGWQRAGLAAPVNATIRARGYVVGGSGNGSAYFVETAVGAPLLTAQPTTAANFTNTTMAFTVTAMGTQPIAYQWYKNGALIANATNSAYSIPSSASSDAGNYQVVLTNGFGAVTSVVAALTLLTPPLLDALNPGVGGIGSGVNSFAVQPNGKILVGGAFNTLGGQPHTNLARLNADGTLDPSFMAAAGGGASPYLTTLALQPDGKILVGGSFASINGQPRTGFGRLNTDGSLDVDFNPGANGQVCSVAVQADGRIVVVGLFTSLAGATRNHIGRLNANGSLDTDFDPGASGSVYCIARQSDGKMLVGGNFTSLGGQSRNNLARINVDGTLDTTFNAPASSYVNSLAVQPDGRILIGGNFTVLGGLSCSRFGRLNADGTLDTSFNAGANNSVYSLALQANGKILVGGQFTTLAGQTNSYLGRVNADGSADATFNPGASSSVYSLMAQPDGKVLAGGAFTTLGGQSRSHLARLNNTEPAIENLSFDASSVTWLRGGSGPEAWRTTFDVCTNGSDWVSLGDGTRIPGGWQQSELSLPTHSTIRARGFCAGGQYNASSSFVETLVGAPFITCQPTNVANFTNSAMAISVTVAGTEPIAYQWYKNGGAITDATNLAYGIQYSAAGDAGSYRMVASNSFGMVTSAVATLTILTPVSADAFNPGVGGVPNPFVNALAVQPDGKILVGGYFSTLGGQTCTNLGRLNADGSLETAWNADESAPYLSSVLSLALQPDGKILVGGAFTMLAGQPRTYLGRFNGDGSLDTTFNPYIPGAGQGVLSLVVQADGKILVGGNFTSLAGQSRNYLGRLKADGSPDPDFNPNANKLVSSLAVQPDGKILVAGDFTALAGQTRSHIARLYPDGTLDPDFHPAANDTVNCVAVQPDGKILLGGLFTSLASQNRTNLGRLNADGSLDSGFNPVAAGLYSSSVYSLALQSDGKILVCGYFATLAGQTCNHLGRLNANGSLDTTFNAGAGFTVLAVAVQADGTILAGGAFGNLGGAPRNGLGRLSNTQPATESLSCTGTTLTWLRGGTSPEAWRTTFDACTNGTDWISLGDATRITGGWQQTGLSLPDGTTIRARAFCSGGRFNSSSWYVETGLGPAAVSQQPDSRTNNAGSIAQFVALGAGAAPLGCQWRKGGVLLSDSGNISGSQTATLTLTNVLGADAGSYSVIITNSNGSVTSQVATLSVVDPFISAQPVSQTVNAGSTVLFSATIAGTESLGYQWRRNGVDVAAATGPSLTLTNVQWADAGGYELLVSNRFGTATSTIAPLAVNGPVIPVNDGSFGPHTNGFGFNVGCMPGQAVVIEASTNLLNWVPVQTNLVTSEGIFLFVDRDSGIYPWRLYRARPYAGSLPAPAMDISAWTLGFPTNPFGFNLCGVAGQNVVIEASTNLTNWVPLATNRLRLDPLYFSDPVSTNLTQRFYRAVPVP